MVLAKFIVFVSLYYVVSAASVNQTKKQGYLIMDTTKSASCHDMPKNKMCPSFKHKVVGADKTLRLVHTSFQAVKLQLATARFLNATQTCLDDLREYSCSNVLMKCKKSDITGFGFKLDYDVNRTKKACANVKNSCSPIIQAATIHNCSLIQTDPFEFAKCKKHTSVAGDICPSTNYLYPVAITKFYPIHAKAFNADFPKYAVGFRGGNCRQEIISVYCQLMRGAICSQDRTKRMYAISQQDCDKTARKCILFPAYEAYFRKVCKLFPDKKTTKVPLPPGTSYSNNPLPPGTAYSNNPLPPGTSYSNNPLPPGTSYSKNPLPPGTSYSNSGK